MKSKLIGQLKAHGACAVGIVRARLFSELEIVLNKRGRTALCEPDTEKRINPFLLMPEAKSIAVCLFSYYTGIKTNISEYALGLDYHRVLKIKMEAAATVLTDSGYKTQIYADTSPLNDRYLAYLAGLGFIGKNGMLINEKYGSMTFIGYIITDCFLDEDKPLENNACIGCGKCIKACPGRAIGENYEFDENKCVSFLTQKKGELTEQEKNIIKSSGYAWGCDICQKICPYNKSVPHTEIGEFSDVITSIDLPEGISNKEFMRLYGSRAFAWRGKAVLKRNLELFK